MTYVNNSLVWEKEIDCIYNTEQVVYQLIYKYTRTTCAGGSETCPWELIMHLDKDVSWGKLLWMDWNISLSTSYIAQGLSFSCTCCIILNVLLVFYLY